MSAIGRVGATCSQNAKTLDEYYDCLDQGRLPVVRGLALDGALTMALFALGSSVLLLIGPWLLLRLRGNGRGEWGIRLAGLALVLTSGWALWMGLVHNTAPWCITP